MEILAVTDEELKLLKSLCDCKSISIFSINPKSLPLVDLFGSFNERKKEWTDGGLTSIMR